MMDILRLSENVSVTVTHSDPWNWMQHPDDAALRLPKFLTYIGGNNKRKLSQIVAQTPYPIKAELRDGRRMKPWRYELKIWGLSWADAQNLAADLDPIGFDASADISQIELAA